MWVDVLYLHGKVGHHSIDGQQLHLWFVIMQTFTKRLFHTFSFSLRKQRPVFQHEGCHSEYRSLSYMK